MTEEQILDYLESMVSFNLDCEFEYLRDRYSDKKFDAETCKKLLNDDATGAYVLMDALDYIKAKKTNLQKSSEHIELAGISDEALVQEIKDRGLEKYL
jgi:hypothetical protein